MYKLVDTHCHLDFDRFDEDRDLVVDRATKAGVQRIIAPAIDLESCQKVLSLAEKYESVFVAVGIHPNSSAEWQDDWTESLRKFAAHPKVIAIGEIGLDYYRDWSPHAIQKRSFSAQLTLAGELDLPVIIHNREAEGDVIRHLFQAKEQWSRLNGVLHSFSSSWETADKAIEMGFYLGFTGPLTYKNAKKLRDVAAKIRLDRLVIETDSPFLAPQKYRGKRNEPAYVVQVAAKLAEIHSMTLNEIALQTTENAGRLFGHDLRLHL